VQKKNVLDYFSFGMPMPNRHIQDANAYRYAYQGQEKDPETGKEAFELRLWDGRIGRWLTTDPYGQYVSPYLGMGNNPISSIDPDGGWKTKWSRFWAWVRGGFRGRFITTNSSNPNKKYGITQLYSSAYRDANDVIGQKLTYVNSFTYKELVSSRFREFGPEIGEHTLSQAELWKNSNNKLKKAIYNFSNQTYVFLQTFNPFQKYIKNLDNSGVVRGSNQHIDGNINTLLTLVPFGKATNSGAKGLGYIKKINASQFSTIFRGNLSKLTPKTRGLINRNINKLIVSPLNTQISGGKILMHYKILHKNNH